MISDEALSNRYKYSETHHECAYCAIVPADVYPHCRNEGAELEHIFQRMSQKIDDPSNYVMTCRPAHEWKHANSVLGRIAALVWKWKHEEFQRMQLMSLVGMDPIGWIDNRRSEPLPEWAARLAKEIVEAHAECR